MNTAQRTPAKLPRLGQMFALAAIVGLGASLAACSPQESTAPTAGASSSSSTSAPSSSSSPQSPTSAVTTPSALPTPTSAAPTPPPNAQALCTAASLKGALDDSGGGAAGSIFMKLIVTNSSTTSCILDGYPGVSMVPAGTIDYVGAPAERDPAAPSNGPITLAPGQSSAAVLRYTQAGNYQNCQRVQAEAILVYPPSATDSLEIPHPLTACTNAGIKLLRIGAFQP
ncbi:DUF4232 domain-containing protein [Arthrobacter antibioticus]|uniref:DUF4232 domain-containing protein n=1 Tax=Arthrobacter sp. H35-MC1 TaxID=3046203 RepID=UPI0024B9A792|nr:DUF4232 domain-containing protein [Arthrobacter sp. H35-MC1]MDJ0317969.1 DUF4232 domain-containing protein [Arthrobacter sp. H35-MC1]